MNFPHHKSVCFKCSKKKLIGDRIQYSTHSIFICTDCTYIDTNTKICAHKQCESKFSHDSSEIYCGKHKYVCLHSCPIGRRPEPLGYQYPNQSFDCECNCDVSEQSPFGRVMIELKNS